MDSHHIRSIIIPLTLLAAVSACMAGHVVKRCMVLDYRSAPDIVIKSSGDGTAGIAAFERLGNDRVALLCNVTNTISIHRFSDGALLRSIPLPAGPRDITWGGSRFFIRYSDRILSMDAAGGQRSDMFLTPSLTFISRLKWRQGTLYALTADGYSCPLSSNGKPLDADRQIRERIRGWVLDDGRSALPVITGDWSGEVRVFSGPDSTCIPLTSRTPLGCMRIIGAVDSALYVEIQSIEQQAPLRVSRSIARLSIGEARIIDSFTPPPCTFMGLQNGFLTDGRTLWHAVTTGESVWLFRMAYDSRVRKTDFPAAVSHYYHYNDHLPDMDRRSAPAGTGRPKPLPDPITRSEIMANADAYVQNEWICEEENTSNNTIITLPDDALIKTPAWVTVGPKKRTPYKWGGFTHIDIFGERILAGCYAGDVYTDDMNRDNPHTVSYGDNYCVGVDCSGLVSRAWNQPIKHWTGSLPDISIPLEKWSDVRPGDIADKIAAHVMLIVYRNSSGTLSIVHANGTYEDVSYDIKTLYDLSGYTPMQYAAVIDDNWEPDTYAWTTLYQNYPNPVLESTAFSFYLAYESEVTISVFNVLGQRVAVPFSGHAGEGTHTLSWDPGELPSGLYFYQLRTTWDTVTKKCTLVR